MRTYQWILPAGECARIRPPGPQPHPCRRPFGGFREAPTPSDSSTRHLLSQECTPSWQPPNGVDERGWSGNPHGSESGRVQAKGARKSLTDTTIPRSVWGLPRIRVPASQSIFPGGCEKEKKWMWGGKMRAEHSEWAGNLRHSVLQSSDPSVHVLPFLSRHGSGGGCPLITGLWPSIGPINERPQHLRVCT